MGNREEHTWNYFVNNEQLLIDTFNNNTFPVPWGRQKLFNTIIVS